MNDCVISDNATNLLPIIVTLYRFKNKIQQIFFCLKFRLTLERSSTKECVFSLVKDENSVSFTLRYRKNTDEKKGEFINADGENLRGEITESCYYFMVIDEFLSGYEYEFELWIKTFNNETIRYYHKILSLRGKNLFIPVFLCFCFLIYALIPYTFDL